MKNKSLVWFTLFSFFLSIGMGVIIPPKPVMAVDDATITEMANQIAAVYAWLNDGDKQAIREARTKAINMQRVTLKGIVAPLLTPEVESRFSGNAAAAEDALIDFARDYSEIYYPADGDWANKLKELRDEAVLRVNFQKLMDYGKANEVTFDELIQLAKDTKELTPGVVKNNATYLNTVLSKNDQELSAVIYEIAEAAVREALNQDQNLKQRLQSLGWTADMLSELQRDLSIEVDPQHKADLALLYGYIRSESKLVYENDQEPEVFGGDAYSLEPGKSLKVKVLGRDLGQIGIRITDSNSNIVNWPQDQHGCLVVPSTPGSYLITGYRDFPGADPDTSYILLKNVFIFDDAELTNADLEWIKIDGTVINGFLANKLEYVITLAATDPIPDVTVKVSAGGATYQITSSTPNQTQTVKEIVVTAPDGTTKKTYKVVFVKPVTKSIDDMDNVDWTETPNIALSIPPDADLENIVVPPITIPAGVTNPTLTVQPKLEGGKKVASLPTLNVTDSNGVKLDIPGGIKISGPAGWDGTLELPTVLTDPPSADIPDMQAVGAVINFGYGNADLTFDKAIKLLAPNQAGKSAGYIKNGVFQSITLVMAENTQTWADNNIPAGGDGCIDETPHKAIWIKHATEFVTYTPQPTPPGGGGGGGGGATTGTSVTAAQGGTVTSGSASVVIPANALAADARIKIEKLTSTAGLTFAANQKLVSEIYDITKDKSGDFKKPVSITLGFDPSKVDTSKYDLIICWYDSTNKKWVELDNIKIDLTGKKVTGDTSHFTKFAVIAVEKTVVPTTDLTDIKGHWAVNEIVSLVDLKVLSGYPDKTFKPNNDISRAEFATVLVKALKLEARTGKVFADTANHWAKDFIATANAYGIINGYSDSRFGPNDPITREQMAVMIANALKLSDSSASVSFTDANTICDWAKDAVAVVAEKGIITGYPDGSFKPDGKLTRAEAASVTIRALNTLQK